ncbi:MAG: family 10 glycosylhydrolase [bacterium]
MNRREFFYDLGIKTTGLAGCLTLLNSYGFGYTDRRKSKNWIWITPDTEATDDEWKRRCEILKKVGIDALIPEIYTGRAAYYGSNFVPVKAELLERLIPIARSFDLEIHTWMWSMPCMLEEIMQKHPDWYMVNRLGESVLNKPAYVDYYKFLCPSKEGVHEFLQNMVSELSQYDVDGIHLDYIRFPDVILAKGLWEKYNLVQDREYPQFDYCYCSTCRKKFQDQEGIDPLEIKKPSMHQVWLQFRYDLITNLVNEKLIPIARKNKKNISAAVFPNWRNVRQEWRSWKLNSVLPMLYNQFYLTNAEWIKQCCREGVKSLQYDTTLYSGLMVDEPDKFRKYIVKSFEGGAQGISIFALRRLTNEHFEMLAQVLKKY